MSYMKIDTDTMTEIADAIREKAGDSDLISPAEMAEKISALPAGGQGVTITVDSQGKREISYDISEDMIMVNLAGIKAIKSVDFVSDLPEMPPHFFRGSSFAVPFTIPECVADLYEDVFYECSGPKLIIPDTVYSLCPQCLRYSKFPIIVFADDIELEEIGEMAFYGAGVKTLIIPDSVLLIDQQAFCYSDLTHCYIPSTCEEINCTSNWTSPPFRATPSSCQIYTDADAALPGWKSGWNDGRTVHYGVSKSEFKEIIREVYGEDAYTID